MQSPDAGTESISYLKTRFTHTPEAITLTIIVVYKAHPESQGWRCFTLLPLARATSQSSRVPVRCPTTECIRVRTSGKHCSTDCGCPQRPPRTASHTVLSAGNAVNGGERVPRASERAKALNYFYYDILIIRNRPSEWTTYHFLFAQLRVHTLFLGTVVDVLYRM